MQKINTCHEVTPADIGKYIRLGGLGIVDGLQGQATKHDTHKITAVDEHGIHLKQYRAKNGSILPTFNFSQPAELYTAQEFKALPKAY